MKYQKENFKGKIFSSKIFIICAFIVVGFMATAVAKEFYRKYQIQEEISSLQEEIKKIEEDNRELSELIEYLKTESYLEKEARLKLNLQKPGEELVIVSQEVEDNSVEKEEGEIKTNGEKNPQEISNPRKWWNYLFGSK